MKKTFLIIFLLFLFLTLSVPIFAQITEGGGTLIVENIPAPSMTDNMFKISDEQPVAVYLPPSYDVSGKKYPVVYYLPGFSQTINLYISWEFFQGYDLKESMDRLISQGIIPEMIMVIPNGTNFMFGGFYENSKVAGNWRDFIINDLVNYMDNNYRTIASSTSRAIGGHSMGGFGALNLAMKHSDVFGAAYGLAPALFDQNGLEDMGMFTEENIRNHLSYEKKLMSMDKHEAMLAFLSQMTQYCMNENIYQVYQYAYGAAFSPNAKKQPPYINYPYSEINGKLVVNEKYMNQYRKGHGNLARKVKKYKENLHELNAFVMDYGIYEWYDWIPRGCEYLSDLLTAENIPHQVLTHEGDHESRVKERIENSMLPLFADVLHFE